MDEEVVSGDDNRPVESGWVCVSLLLLFVVFVVMLWTSPETTYSNNNILMWNTRSSYGRSRKRHNALRDSIPCTIFSQTTVAATKMEKRGKRRWCSLE